MRLRISTQGLVFGLIFFCADHLDSLIFLLAQNPTVGFLISFSMALKSSGDMVGTILLFKTSFAILKQDIAGSTLVESAVPGHADVDHPPNRNGSYLPRWGQGPRLLPSLFLSTYCCSSLNDKALISCPLMCIVCLQKSRQTPYVFMNGVPIMQSYQSMFTRLRYIWSWMLQRLIGTLVP